MKKKSVTTKSTNQTAKFGTTAQAKPVETVKEEVKDTVKAAETKISEKVDDAATKASETVTSATTKVEEKVSDVVAKAEEKVSDAATKVSETVAEKATDVKATVKTAAKKTADKVTASTKKAEKEVLIPEIYVQYAGRESNEKDIVERIKATYVAEGHRAGSIKSLQVYLKPEEDAAYYVINQKYAGRVSLF
ncbi:MAG: DUF6465 family protein [Lachnospiraceae bacterium]|nr:DUF6465 family protein [Lachnospiraceae bacterium]